MELLHINLMRFIQKQLGPAMVVMGGLMGCLLPPPIGQAPDEYNLPPQIIPDSLTPAPTEGPKLMSIHCSGYPFFARISDPDQNDTLYWRVFLDYHRDENPILSEVQVLPPGPNRLVDADLIQFTISPNNELFIGGGRMDEAHQVELLVSDRPFESQPIAPEGRGLVDESGLWDSFVWTVELTDEARSCPMGDEGA